MKLQIHLHMLRLLKVFGRSPGGVYEVNSFEGMKKWQVTFEKKSTIPSFDKN